MVKKILLVLIFFISLMTRVSAIHGQSPKETVILPSGEVVCDLNGEWNALHSHYGPMQWVGDIKSMVKITMQVNKFVGTSLIATGYSPAGTEKVRGELDKDGIKNIRYYRPDIDWQDAKGEISKDCNKIVIDDSQGVKTILERK